MVAATEGDHFCDAFRGFFEFWIGIQVTAAVVKVMYSFSLAGGTLIMFKVSSSGITLNAVGDNGYPSRQNIMLTR